MVILADDKKQAGKEESKDLRARKILISIAHSLVKEMNSALSELRRATYLCNYNSAFGEQRTIFKSCTTEGGLEITVPEPEICLYRISKALTDYKNSYDGLRHLHEHVKREELDKPIFYQKLLNGTQCYYLWPITLSFK